MYFKVRVMRREGAKAYRYQKIALEEYKKPSYHEQLSVYSVTYSELDKEGDDSYFFFLLRLEVEYTIVHTFEYLKIET